MRNLFACLVHEREEVVVDLVRNLRHRDPDSEILLYDGGRDPGLLRRRFSLDGREPLVHPDPTPQSWGALHGFAIDCMRFALQEAPFDTLTIVDSDQLLLRPGYTGALAASLAGRAQVGMLGNAPEVQPLHTRVAPAVTAVRERALWLPYCRRFPGGGDEFPHWTFWPSTVFTAAACRDLVRSFDEDEELARTLAASRLWATEEVLLPTLVALHGHEIARSPFSYDLVRYRRVPGAGELRAALLRPEVFWAHPVPRRVDDPLRRLVRERHGHYRRRPATDLPGTPDTSGAPGTARAPGSPAPAPEPEPLLLTLPILERMRAVEGWLADEEADLLIAALARALDDLPEPHAVVEVGSFCGRATVVLGSVVRALAAHARVHAIDPHDGVVGARDRGLERHGPTLERFERAVEHAGVADVVTTVAQHSWEAGWEGPVSFLLLDGLHDYPSVARDLAQFDDWLVEGGYVAFHDVADYFPGVQRLVGELLAGEGYERVAGAGTMVLLRKRAGGGPGRRTAARAAEPAAPPRVSVATPEDEAAAAPADPAAAPGARPAAPLVSCVMATYDRAHLVPRAIASFLRQTHPETELLVVDDGPESLAGLLPEDERVRHLRLERRRSIGAKRNLGCEAARGELLANWDDDDWYAPWRLAHQIGELTRDGADVCGLDRLLYADPVSRRAWRYAWPPAARPWVHDAVLLFTRDFWRRNPFPDTSMGIDCRMLWTATPKRILALGDERFYVGMVHPGNTSPKQTTNGLWRPFAFEEIEALVDADLAFYRELLGARPLASAERGA